MTAVPCCDKYGFANIVL